MMRSKHKITAVVGALVVFAVTTPAVASGTGETIPGYRYCLDFSSFPDDLRVTVPAPLAYEGFAFSVANPPQDLLIVRGGSPVVNALAMTASGLIIELPEPATEVLLEIGAFAVTSQIRVRDPQGLLIRSIPIPHENDFVEIVIADESIGSIEIGPGQTEVLLRRICSTPVSE